jgi:hypothetical protein
MPPLDLAKVLTRKQEHECARLDDFEFRVRIRAIRLLVESLNGGAGGRFALDPIDWAREAATEAAEATLERLHQHLGAASPGLGEIYRRHQRAVARAYEQVVVERGDPSPFRMA